MPLTHEDIDDFTNAVVPRFKKLKYRDFSLEYQSYVSAQLLDEKTVGEEGGDSINWDVNKANTGSAKVSGLYDEDETSDADTLAQASVPFCKLTCNYSYDIDLAAFQTDGETIIKLLMHKEHRAKNDMVELNEQLLWSAPTSSSQKRPMGIPFWFQKDASTTPEGAFNGGDPSGFTAGAAGIAVADIPRWKNWTFGYENASVDLVRKVKFAMWSTHFEAPVPYPELGYSKAQWVMFTTYTTREALERLAETRNDNLGPDVAKYIDAILIGGVPVKAVPYLQANDSSHPIYGINWRHFRPFIKTGTFMRRTGPFRAARQHTVREVHFDTWMNYCCYDRREGGFVGSIAV